MNIADIIFYAKKVDNYEKDATGATTKWPDTTHFIVTVPADKRWLFIGGFIGRTVNATVSGHIYNSADAILRLLCEEAAAATGFGIPKDSSAYGNMFPYIMDAGDYAQFTFGVAQDANAYASFQVLEVDI